MAKKTQVTKAFPRKGASKKRTATTAGPTSLESHLLEVIRVVDVADLLTVPLVNSIESLLRGTARNLNCDTAAVLVRDGTEGDLRFLTAIGPVADQVKQMKIPAGRGVAGFVFSSGQPMAVSEAGKDKTFYAEVDLATGYATQTVLATPLRSGDDVVGVLEFVNREGEPPFKPFTPEEMDMAGIYADAMAVLVDTQERVGLIEVLFEQAVHQAGFTQAASESLLGWLRSVRSAPEHQDLIRLAVALADVTRRGQAERELCRELMESVGRFTKTSRTTYGI